MIEILAQPDDTTCGPTCLHAVYRYFGDAVELEEIIDEVPVLASGGTLGVLLATHALGRGYRATIYTYNLGVFDPTWFVGDVDLAAKLREQNMAKSDPRVLTAGSAYLEFLAAGGELRYEQLSTELLHRLVQASRALITGLSATYLYGSPREKNDRSNDIEGHPVGHFVVLGGGEAAPGSIYVSDPLGDNPPFGRHHYTIEAQRLMGAILLGIVTHDANLIVIER